MRKSGGLRKLRERERRLPLKDRNMIKASEMTPAMLKELAFTQDEIDEQNRSRNMPITFDEDCPETTPERAVAFHRVNPPNKTGNGEKHPGA